jgi:hypothetical protein
MKLLNAKQSRKIRAKIMKLQKIIKKHGGIANAEFIGSFIKGCLSYSPLPTERSEKSLEKCQLCLSQVENWS